MPKKHEIRDKVLALVERLNKMDAWKNFIKVQHKTNLFLIRSNYLLLEKERKLVMSIVIGYQKKILID